MNSIQEKPKSYFQNWISVIGGILSVFLFAAILFLFILDLMAGEKNPYLGVVSYLIMPVFLFTSLVMIPFGAWQERTRRQRRGYVPRFPKIDFNNPVHQRWAYTGIGVTTLFLLFTIFGVYRAYEFTESVTFCGQLCHNVMDPEYTAYHNSPHARVSCVQCHIGPGAEWYVRCKISGIRQVYRTVTNTFNKPVETPVVNLRPAQETCEQCHWPQQFFGALEQDHEYFLSDENNTQWKTRMLMFVGGGTPPYGKKEGIHWHMNIKNSIYYIATDKKRQVIPWIQKIGPDGKEEIYVDKASGYSAENPPKGEKRRMDCMDCHSRPSHDFKAPMESVNEALSYGVIDKSLPYIKREAVKILAAKYASQDEAAEKIRQHIENFYSQKYPDIWKEKKDIINKAVDALIEVYRINFFPQMGVSWKNYPDNIGHFMFPGCFRCHDEQHKTAGGRVLSRDCATCHVVTSQGKPDLLEKAVDGLEFKHPDESVGDAWKEMNCYDCHTGGPD